MNLRLVGLGDTLLGSKPVLPLGGCVSWALLQVLYKQVQNGCVRCCYRSLMNLFFGVSV